MQLADQGVQSAETRHTQRSKRPNGLVPQLSVKEGKVVPCSLALKEYGVSSRTLLHLLFTQVFVQPAGLGVFELRRSSPGVKVLA